MTSREPFYTRPDIANRALTIFLADPTERISVPELIQTINNHRAGAIRYILHRHHLRLKGGW